MKRSTVLLSGVIVLLLASNLWWAYASIDCGITASYGEVSLRDSEIALKQTLAILPVVAASPGDRAGIIAAATKSADDPQSFVKNGYFWVGRIGLKFAPDGRLVEVTTEDK